MKSRDYIVMFGVIMIVMMLIIPLPSSLLSFLIVLNISLALIILLITLNVREALDFSVFPSLLLIMTLFRIGLNVSTTRLILSKGDAGQVISAFGQFVVGGNVIVGLVVFMILIIVQFIVITKGAERVAEVAARFTLDAMPGKQMSIDADMNAGLINDQEAKKRREKITREADFYGAMDGASKFVKGDAIASMIIVAINLVVGMIIGMAQLGMSLASAAQNFSLLSVGDGIVSQIPALLISTATGIVVTRSSSESNMGKEVADQLLAYPATLVVTGIVIFILGLTPIGMVATLPIALLLVAGGLMIRRNRRKAVQTVAEDQGRQREQKFKSQENVISLLNMDPVEFEFGYALVPLADSSQGGDLLDRIVMIRRQLALELGIILPVVRIRDNIQLEPDSYRIKINGSEVANGKLMLDHYLAMSPGVEDDSIKGIETKEPAFGLKALWIDEPTKERAEMAGYTVVDPPSVVSTHLTEVLRRHAYELIGRQEVKQLVDHLKEQYPALVEAVTPEPLSIGEVQKVLVNLLKEKLSIRKLPVIFETLADYAPMTKDPGLLTEYVRQSLSRQITEQFAKQGESLKVLTLSPDLERKISESVQKTEHGNFLAMDTETTTRLLKNLSEAVGKWADMDSDPVILCSPAVRMYVHQLTERYFPNIYVLSYNELETNVEVQSIGVLNAA
ncbi:MULTISPECIES: flagellar biosynthesis protein FlhA [unclassified Sporolactobacillus]|uniref:flagellar biosynthesis protein FlhA n=1 Tax=unclassified Sporolactobacillus TaxID=2628533 RepID=UPI0023674794|nr:flagellar biosynthesis protein FlhA [Sporolactobacillus sp. CQH2019]MDD9147048.1 flagellar biosynthesis protein FlhA [Sporolactobacillus sp. CQH2019]